MGVLLGCESIHMRLRDSEVYEHFGAGKTMLFRSIRSDWEEGWGNGKRAR